MQPLVIGCGFPRRVLVMTSCRQERPVCQVLKDQVKGQRSHDTGHLHGTWRVAITTHTKISVQPQLWNTHTQTLSLRFEMQPLLDIVIVWLMNYNVWLLTWLQLSPIGQNISNVGTTSPIGGAKIRNVPVLRNKGTHRTQDWRKCVVTNSTHDVTGSI